MTKSSGIAHVEALEPEDARSGDATQQRRVYVRRNVLHQHLERAIRHMPSTSSQVCRSTLLSESYAQVFLCRALLRALQCQLLFGQ